MTSLIVESDAYDKVISANGAYLLILPRGNPETDINFISSVVFM